jgi:hypothetical protein
MQNRNETTPGLALYVTLTPQDAELLRAAVPAAAVPRDALGTKDTLRLAQTALSAVARAILRQGYQPQPLSAEMRLAGAPVPGTLPPGVITVQLG